MFLERQKRSNAESTGREFDRLFQFFFEKIGLDPSLAPAPYFPNF
jgi:hypothetical protein